MIGRDVQKHVHSLKSTVYQVKGQVNGQTVLPLPVGIDRVQEAEKEIVESKGEICDLFLKSSIESVVIKWAMQVKDVLCNNSSELGQNGAIAVPSVEMQFWGLRLKNLQNIYDQLREPKVKSMAVILEESKSAYFVCFSTLFKEVVLALAEAKDIDLYLGALRKHTDGVQETEFSEVTPLLKPMLHVVCLIWANSKHYDQAKLVVLLKQICNLLIQEVTIRLPSYNSKT